MNALRYDRLERVFGSVVSFLAFALAGCTGGENPTRHQTTGTVTYDGRGVEYGTIIFEPELSVGRLAPTGYARIENGTYRTSREESPTTGTYKVRVLGFDKSKMKKVGFGDNQFVSTPDLFPEYVLNVEIPSPKGRLDIEVPKRKGP